MYWQQQWPMLSYSIYVVCSLYVTFLLPPERAPKVLAPSLLILVFTNLILVHLQVSGLVIPEALQEWSSNSLSKWI